MQETFVNKVAESGIISIDLESYFPKSDTIVGFDLKPYLFMELILKEKDFRAALLTTDWSVYEQKNVAIFCSADAIIPMWAYMLITAYLQPIATEVFFGTIDDFKQHLLLKNIQSLNVETFTNQRVVVKGCGEIAIPAAAYVAITQLLRNNAKSIMYGEPCSTVPIFKKKNT